MSVKLRVDFPKTCFAKLAINRTRARIIWKYSGGFSVRIHSIYIIVEYDDRHLWKFVFRSNRDEIVEINHSIIVKAKSASEKVSEEIITIKHHV